MSISMKGEKRRAAGFLARNSLLTQRPGGIFFLTLMNPKDRGERGAPRTS